MGGAVSNLPLHYADRYSDLLRLSFLESPGNTTLNFIMLDVCLRIVFLDFLQTKKIHSNLLYYEAVEEFKQLKKTNESSEIAFYDAFQNICAKFLMPHAPFLIDIPSELNASIIKLGIRKCQMTRVTGIIQCERELERAQKEVYKVMEKVLLEFSRSSIFQNFLKGESTVVHVVDVMNVNDVVQKLNLSSQKKKTLLLVEKDPLLSMILVKLLEDRDYTVKTASNGSAASALLMSNVFDTALIGIELPDKTGVKVLHELFTFEDRCREKLPNYSRPFLIATTVKPGNIHEKFLLSVGFNSVLLKPFRMSDFHELRPQNSRMRQSRRYSAGRHQDEKRLSSNSFAKSSVLVPSILSIAAQIQPDKTTLPVHQLDSALIKQPSSNDSVPSYSNNVLVVPGSHSGSLRTSRKSILISADSVKKRTNILDDTK